MSKKRIIQILFAIVAAEIICIAAICSRDSRAELVSDVTVRDIEPQAVLYTIHRGHYENIGSEINRLYEIADAKGISTTGPVSTGYLNNPQLHAPEHWLVEIRIPVCSDAIKLAGTLGWMTDIKLLPPMKVAAAVKPEGQDNPETVIYSLYSWINEHNFRIVGNMWQTVLCKQTDDYSQMITEFIIPIQSLDPSIR
ncbi:MAG: GyrI-like domain-containing protein [Sedimentisphaerales bacterium]|nr:GyrI-like domain-containing protein [Sedimentisphaerales bacterium]